ncbi:MAG TPA: hypothetical protein VMJ32_05160 [Pirellulales bacterium]|nr:hypothetical protein [Pirellulales bacterium]
MPAPAPPKVPAPKTTAPKPVASPAPAAPQVLPQPPASKTAQPIVPQPPVQATPPASLPAAPAPHLAVPAAPLPVKPILFEQAPSPAIEPQKFTRIEADQPSDIEPPQATPIKLDEPSIIEPELPETMEESASFEGQIVADALVEDVAVEDMENALPQVAIEMEAELLPAERTRFRAAKKAYSPLSTAGEALSEIEAAPKNIGDWLRTRPIWFWAAVAAVWLVAAVLYVALTPHGPSRQEQEWERLRQLYMQSQPGKKTSAPAGKADQPPAADQTPAKSDGAQKSAADAPAK